MSIRIPVDSARGQRLHGLEIFENSMCVLKLQLHFFKKKYQNKNEGLCCQIVYSSVLLTELLLLFLILRIHFKNK